MKFDPFAPAQRQLDEAKNEGEKIEAAKQALVIGIGLFIVCAVLLAIGLLLLFVVAPSL